MRAISTLQTFQSLQHYLELQQWIVFDTETKKLLIRRISRLALKCFDFRVHINPGNIWQKWKSPGHCRGVSLLQATIRKFSRKTSTWKENRTREKHLRAAASETQSFRRTFSGQVTLLCIVQSFDFSLTF